MDPSPLHRFVVAKRTIGSIFDHLLDFVKTGSAFVEEVVRSQDLGRVAGEDQNQEMQKCATKLATIREVLLRRHMKVAFFGRWEPGQNLLLKQQFTEPVLVCYQLRDSNDSRRGYQTRTGMELKLLLCISRTSNGKSTVINAMLRHRVLPSGIGHTTNCFLSVEGTDAAEAFLTTEASAERRCVSTVNQLAHALHMDPALDSGSLVRVFWPKSCCALLRDDLVLMDSPGTDVTLELDSWIDKFCLDADVFVLVGNAESTLMNTEKLFFHKVSERISKPNIFILNNRWDASVTEPDYIDQVRKQHLQRCVSFLSEELRVVGPEEAAARIFFVSAKEVLSTRTQRSQGMPETGETGGALAEGFQERLREFQHFERTFEEFISRSAVRTKFQQHTVRAQQITEDIKAVMDAINITSADRKICCLEEREEQRDRLDFVRGQMNRLSDSMKNRTRTLTDDVAAKVGSALLDQINSLPVLVEEFRSDFNPTQENLQLYKARLVQHVEERLVACLAHRCSIGVLRDIRDVQRLMIDSVRPLVSLSVQQQLSAPPSSFEMTYDLTLAALCADFREDIDFRFSLGWTALVSRFIGAGHSLKDGASLQDEVVVSMATGLLSVSSRASMAVLVIGGVVSRSVGWRVVALSVSLYGVLYLYERLTWTNASKERALKQQFTEHAASRLRAVVPVTSSACSQQVFKELTATFDRLTQRVDLSEAELEGRVRQLSSRILQLETIQRTSKAFRNRGTELELQLEDFSARYLQAAD